jgi:hypothetical protein
MQVRRNAKSNPASCGCWTKKTADRATNEWNLFAACISELTGGRRGSKKVGCKSDDHPAAISASSCSKEIVWVAVKGRAGSASYAFAQLATR